VLRARRVMLRPGASEGVSGKRYRRLWAEVENAVGERLTAMTAILQVDGLLGYGVVLDPTMPAEIGVCNRVGFRNRRVTSASCVSSSGITTSIGSTMWVLYPMSNVG